MTFLQSYDIPAEFSGKNDILVNGMKISGNAQAIHVNRILHHGTLLFNSDLTKLGKILKPKMDKLESNGVSSIESRVTNILPYFKEGYAPTIAEFKDKLLKKLLQIQDEDEIMSLNIYELDDNDKNAINDLVNTKYSTYNWNYNNIEVSEFNVNKYCRYEGGGGITFRLKIVDEKIENVKIFGDFLGYKDISDIENSLKNVMFTRDIVKKKLQNFNLKEYLGNITLYNILDCLFNNNNIGKKNFGVSIKSLEKSIFTELGSNLVEYNTTSKKRSIRMKNVNESGVTYGDLLVTNLSNNRYKVGITGKIYNDQKDDDDNVFILSIEPPEVGRILNGGEKCGSIGTTKTIIDIIAPPYKCKVVSVNDDVVNNPEKLNLSVWIFEIEAI